MYIYIYINKHTYPHQRKKQFSIKKNERISILSSVLVLSIWYILRTVYTVDTKTKKHLELLSAF